MSAITRLKDRAQQVLDSDSVRDFLDADVVVDAMLYLYAARFAGVVNIGSGISTTVAEVALRVSRNLGTPVEFDFLKAVEPSALRADIGVLRAIVASVIVE